MKLLQSAIAITILSTSAASNAAVTNLFSNESDFLTNYSSLSMESFESASSSNLPLVAGDISVTTNNTSYGSFNGTSTSYGITDGSTSIVYGADDGDSIFFDFNSSINTFGINIWGFGTVGTDQTLTFSNNIGETVLVLSGSNNTEYEFFGIQTDSAFSTVEFSYTGANGDGIYFDEAYYGTTAVSAVPEPSTYALMLGGLGLVGFMATRRKKQQA